MERNWSAFAGVIKYIRHILEGFCKGGGGGGEEGFCRVHEIF